jgi:hypothetical protein|tara:strand:+ start:1491 stop:2213 length:723 start_codon:yes stop_codon:yes gene_type:complete
MAGKGKIGRSIEEAIADLPDVARRWLNSLSDEKLSASSGEVKPSEWPEFIDKLKNVYTEAPFAFSQYEPNVLKEAIAESADGLSDIALISPKDFRMLAARNIEQWMEGGKYYSPDDPITQDIFSKINKYADMYEDGIPFDDIPRLEVDQPFEGVAQVVGHNGRHRVLGQEKLGTETALIKILRRKDYDLKGSDDVLHTEMSHHQPAAEGGGQSYKPSADVLKFLSLGGGVGALGNLVDDR